MGMGEPLANYGNLVTALAILMDPRGRGFSDAGSPCPPAGWSPG